MILLRKVENFDVGYIHKSRVRHMFCGQPKGNLLRSGRMFSSKWFILAFFADLRMSGSQAKATVRSSGVRVPHRNLRRITVIPKGTGIELSVFLPTWRGEHTLQYNMYFAVVKVRRCLAPR